MAHLLRTLWFAASCLATARAGPAERHLQLLASLAPVPCRDDLAATAQHHFRQTGRAAEVGVRAGYFAGANLRKWSGQYWAVDAWMLGSNTVGADPALPNLTAVPDAKLYRTAQRSMAHAGARVRQVRGLSTRVAAGLPDGYFDWIYVDALHTYEAVRDDLAAWWPKLRVGGLFSGDDYADVHATEYLTWARTRRLFHRPARGRDWQQTRITQQDFATQFGWGTVRAVQEFARSVGAVVQITYLLDCYSFPAWYIVKPPPFHNVTRVRAS
jgi:hypothetical protein